MIFILLGIVLLAMKLAGVSPFSEWEWFSIAIPFLAAVVWIELVESWLGWGASMPQNKKPRRAGRGSPFK